MRQFIIQYRKPFRREWNDIEEGPWPCEDDAVGFAEAEVSGRYRIVEICMDSRDSMAQRLRDYLEAQEAFNIVSRTFSIACDGLRNTLNNGERRTLTIEDQCYTVAKDKTGGIHVEKVKR